MLFGCELDKTDSVYGPENGSCRHSNHITDSVKDNEFINEIKKTPWSESASELYRPSDRRLSAK
jgi:hypothetical protein